MTIQRQNRHPQTSKQRWHRTESVQTSGDWLKETAPSHEDKDTRRNRHGKTEKQ